MKEKITRREMSKKMLASIASIAFFETVFTGCSASQTKIVPRHSRSISPKVTPILKHWAVELNEMCNDLKTTSIEPAVWQDGVERLFGRIELPELLKFIDFPQLTNTFEMPDLGVNTKPIKFPKLTGLPKGVGYTKKIFGMKKGRAIIPHGHSNMASAHLVLEGSCRLRHYEKIDQDPRSLIIKPSIDRQATAGDFSSISDERNNVHWFVAETDRMFTFDVIVSQIGVKKYEIHNIDIADAEKTVEGALRVKKIDVQAALKKYGKTHHS